MEKDIGKIAGFTILRLKEYLKTSDKGLSSHEAHLRLSRYGSNTLVVEKKRSAFWEFLSNFKNPLILILLIVGVILFFLGQVLDGLIISVIIFLSVSLNFFQEYRANRAAEKLKEKLSLITTVIRDGIEQNIKASNLTVGDLIVLNAGDLIPADARVIESKDFFINQSPLTGESFPVEKFSNPLNKTDGSPGDLNNIVFSGTNVITGTAKVIVFGIGKETEYGKIAGSLSPTASENDFTQGVTNFGNFILKIVIIFVVIIFFFGVLIKQEILQSLTFAIAVAVGLTPEFLPMIMSVTMGRGAVAMAKKGVIVKRLSAIPTFGSMNVLCTDKTGTLTEDKIVLVTYTDIFGKHSEDVLRYAYLNSINESGITNPLDEAIKSYKKLDVGKYKKIDEIPFDFERKRMSIALSYDKKKILITKGAPEEVLDVCKYVLVKGKKEILDEKYKEIFAAQYTKLSKDGFRVLAISSKTLEDQKKIYHKDDENGLVLLGLTAFLDPVKPGLKETLDKLEEIGIEIKVLTGDNELVARKICTEAGVKIKGVMLGSEASVLSDMALEKRIAQTTIFARFSPVAKERIIKLLKLKGNVVGYMGDGVNDTPSLQAADIGVSVSNAVDVAKETADVILTNKSLKELTEGVVEGRRTFGNTMKYIMMGLSSNFGNMFSVLGAVLFLPFLPMLPIQILLNNLLYDLSQITIPSDTVDIEYIKSPKRWNISFIRKFMVVFGPISSVFDFITFFTMYVIFRSSPQMFQTGWFLESLATQTLVIYIIRTRKIPFIESIPSKFLLFSTLMVVTIGWLLPFSPIGHLFEFARLAPEILAALAVIVITYLFTTEIGKRIFYKSVGSARA